MEDAMYKHGNAAKAQGSRSIWALVALCALAICLGAASSAKAETVTLGQLGTPNLDAACGYCHYLQLKSAQPGGYTVPPGEWTLTSWSGQGGKFSGQVRLDVYRPTGLEGQYTALAQSEMETVPAATFATYAAAIPVQEGDVISLSTGQAGYPGLIATGDERDLLGGVAGSPEPGQTIGNGTAMKISSSHQKTLNIAATLSRPDPLPLEEAPAAGPAPAPTPAPDSTFSLGKQRHKHGRVAVSQTITVAGPGTLSVAGKGIAARQVTATKAGPITVRFAPKGGLLGSLTRHGKAKGTAQIVFTANGGTPATRTETVRFRIDH
jgi:hypothetical protein